VLDCFSSRYINVSGTWYVKDISDLDNHGELKASKCMNFNGSDNTIQTNNLTTTSVAHTVSFWMNSDDLTTTTKIPYCNRS